MTTILAKNASDCQAAFDIFSNAPALQLRHKTGVLGSKEILTELERRGIARGDIAKTLDLDPSQVSRLYNFSDKPRKLTHDEAVKLVAKYRLEQAPEVPHLPAAVWRLLAHHVSSKLGLSLEEDDPRLRGVAADLAAFSRFVRNPRVQGTIQAAEIFFQTLQSVQEPEPVDPPENDPQPVR